MKRLGPELKMPDLGDLKVPAVISDVYLDLRDRRLLPLILLVVVAIVAVPFLLGDDADTLPALPPAAQPEAATGAAAASFTVVEANPGLRAPAKRLDARTPTNPFKQRYTGLPKEARLESTVATSSDTEVVEIEGEIEDAVTEVEEGGPPPSSAPAPREDPAATPPLELVIDVQIKRTMETPDGGEEAGELEVRRNVPVLAQLPGKKTPVATFVGANLQRERLVFLVSHDVKAVTGEFSCVTRGKICEVLEVAPGMLLEYVYEPSGARYAVKVTDARVIRARKRGGADSSSATFGGSVPRSAFGPRGLFQK